jgi:hypothetical protein
VFDHSDGTKVKFGIYEFGLTSVPVTSTGGIMPPLERLLPFLSFSLSAYFAAHNDYIALQSL